MELIFTTAVITVAVAGLIQLFVSSLWASESAGNLTAAMSQAYGKWEEIRATDFDAIPVNYGRGGSPGDNFALSAMTGSGAIYLDTSVPDIIQVTIVVCWQDQNTAIVGEDANFNGRLDAGEDTIVNGRLDSPATLVSLVARR